MKKSLASIGLLVLVALVGACGYTGQVSFPNDLKRIYLDISNTGVFRPGVDTDFTQALTQRILRAGGRVVEERSQADVAMKATITALQSNPVAFDAKDIAQRFRVVVVLDLEVTQRKDRVELAKEQVRGEAYYSAPPGVSGTQVAEKAAIRRALDDLADQIVARVVEPF